MASLGGALASAFGSFGSAIASAVGGAGGNGSAGGLPSGGGGGGGGASAPSCARVQQLTAAIATDQHNIAVYEAVKKPNSTQIANEGTDKATLATNQANLAAAKAAAPGC
jgi:hypothetical protein